MAAQPLKTLFAEYAPVVDRRTAEELIKWRLLYENRGTNADALNTPMLGVYDIGFFASDNQALFDILGVNRDEFRACIKMSSINNSFKVASDEYNLLTVWAAHHYINSDLPSNIKDKAVQAMFFMLLAKFFSSLVRHHFPHKAKQEIMEATIDSLSDKYDIKHEETSTWKLVLEERAKELSSSVRNIHWMTLKTFQPDKKIVYILSDLQTRIRMKIRSIATVYYDMVARGNSIGSTSIVGSDPEGEKTIKELANSFDAMIANVCNKVINTQRFLDSNYIKIVSKMVPNVREDVMRTLLMQYSAAATLQYQRRKQDELSPDKKRFLGYRILITNIVQRTYRACIMDKKVNLKSRYDILMKTSDVYRSSRVSDPIILKIKDSVEWFVRGTRLSNRDATIASLKIAFIMYIILHTFTSD